MNDVLVRMSGGLGNQLFQVSAGLYAIRQYPRAKVWLDTRFLGKYEAARNFEIDFIVKHLPNVGIIKSAGGMAGLASRLRLGRLLDTSFAGYACISSIDELKKLKSKPWYWLVLDGYFQHSDLSLPALDRQEIFSKIATEFAYLIERIPSPIGVPRVGIHIRRGDFVSSKAASNVFQTIHLDYYRAAVSKFSTDSKFLVFGDDPELTSIFAREIDGIDIPSCRLSLQEDFVLMSLCDHYIIANSTFSWWAAHLGLSREKRVISPRRWYVDNQRSNTNPLLLPNFELLDA